MKIQRDLHQLRQKYIKGSKGSEKNVWLWCFGNVFENVLRKFIKKELFQVTVTSTLAKEVC